MSMDTLKAITELSVAIGYLQNQYNQVPSPGLAMNIQGLVEVREMIRKRHEDREPVDNEGGGFMSTQLPYFEEDSIDIIEGYGIEHSHDGSFYPYHIDAEDDTQINHLTDKRGLDLRCVSRAEAVKAIEIEGGGIMSAFIDGNALSNDQRVELYEEGVVWIAQTAMVTENAKPNAEIKLDAQAACSLMDFLLLHGNRLHKHAHRAAQSVAGAEEEVKS